ncbi:MAG TPA: glycosyltransferase family 39 protein, partial [Candidatus Kapabacteria bacterium]|nr:glycosyltransferase family 39 protein [Candidatus Kapabacteria bacterium]
MSKRNSFIARIGERRIVLAIAVIALLFELLNLRPPNFYGEPYLVAKNIVAGKGYVFAYPLTTAIGPTCYVTPLYTYLQVPFLYFGLGERGIQIMNLLFLQAACFVLYRLFRKFTTPGIALLSFAALSFYIPFWILSYTLEPDSLNLLLVVLTVECAYILSKSPSQRMWVWFGVLIGLQLLVRPDIMLGAALLSIWLLAWSRS